MERHAASTEVSYTALTGLQELIEETVTSGELLPPQLKEIKRVCRSGGDACVRTAHKCLMQHLEREHSQIRLVCFEIIDQLFSRSHLFRKLTIDSFKQLVALCVGLDDIHEPLPPPQSFAKLLRYRSLRFVHEANEKWGAEHKQIQLAYNHLRRTQKVNFRSVVEESRQERQAADDRARRKSQSHKVIYEKAERELKGCRRDVDSVLTQLDECLPMVVPRFDLATVTADLADLHDIADMADATEHVAGLAPSTEELTITVTNDSRVNVYESDDNQALVQTIRDNYKRLLRTHRPWVEATLIRLQRNIDPRATALLPSMVTLKSRIATTMARCDELRIIGPASPVKAGAAGFAATGSHNDDDASESDSDSDSDDGDELEEVGTEKEGYEPSTLDPGPPAPPTTAAGVATPDAGSALPLSHRLDRSGEAGSSLPMAAAAAAGPTSEELGVRRMRELGLLPSATGDAVAAAAGPAAQSTVRQRAKRKKKKKPDTLVDAKRDTNNPRARLMKKLKRKKKN